MTSEFRNEIQQCDRKALERYQLDRLNRLLERVLPGNEFYRNKFGKRDLHIRSLQEWAEFPLSLKSEWLNSDNSGVALHHTYSSDQYRRYHRTSGTRGRPMVIMDTAEDWQWWVGTWQYVLDACGIQNHDRIMMAFSFGPFIGFWSAHDACLQRGCMVIPSGGMSTAARIDLIQSAQPTVLFSTPSYALHLAQDARSRNIDLSHSSIQQVFVAGEPGGSVPAIRSRIERLFGAQVMDHAGATEIGPWGFGSTDGKALHVIESEFIAEYLPLAPSTTINLSDAEDATHSEVFELVLTSLGRLGAPALRYRTGDLVRPNQSPPNGSKFVRLEGGVIGRADDMFVVRGVNIFPSSIDAIVRSFSQIIDYRLSVSKNGAMDDLLLEIECEKEADTNHVPQQLSEKLSVQLNLRFDVRMVGAGALPRQEGKAKRIVDLRRQS